MSLVSDKMIEDFQRDGCVLVKGLWKDWVDEIEKGIEQNMAEPGPYAAENLLPGDSGRFFDDYCNWERIKPFERIARESRVAHVAAALMQSKTIQLFHDHVLVKEPGTAKPTPWHQDSPYYFVEGEQTVSFWCPIDPVEEATLRLVAGSHKWPKPVLPTRWLKEESFYPSNNNNSNNSNNNTLSSEDYLPVPDPDAEGLEILEWDMEPGDAIAFDFRVLHGARGNMTLRRRRAFSLRFLGDDARFVERPARTSPPFPGHNMKAGQRLREDWFPIIAQFK